MLHFRISETFDRFEIEMQEDAQHNCRREADSRQVIFEERPHSSHSFSRRYEPAHQSTRYSYDHEHEDRSHGREPAHNNYSDNYSERRHGSIKDRLGPKRKRSTSSEESFKLSKYRNTAIESRCQQNERVSINESQDGNFSATEDEIDFGSLDAILRKCIGKFKCDEIVNHFLY